MISLTSPSMLEVHRDLAGTYTSGTGMRSLDDLDVRMKASRGAYTGFTTGPVSMEDLKGHVTGGQYVIDPDYNIPKAPNDRVYKGWYVGGGSISSKSVFWESRNDAYGNRSRIRIRATANGMTGDKTVSADFVGYTPRAGTVQINWEWAKVFSGTSNKGAICECLGFSSGVLSGTSTSYFYEEDLNQDLQSPKVKNIEISPSHPYFFLALRAFLPGTTTSEQNFDIYVFDVDARYIS